MRTWFKDAPIQRKLLLLILLTSMIGLLLMRGIFFAYEYFTFRQATVRQIATLSKVIATNSTAALAFQNQDDAREVLGALKAEPNLAAAALYDQQGNLFATYPAGLAAAALPAAPGATGFEFAAGHVAGFQPVEQRDRRLGTVYLKYETGALVSAWLRFSLGIGFGVVAVVGAITLALSRVLQRQISEPILRLTETARAVSERNDYSVQAVKEGSDEIGLLTDTFNHMLAELKKNTEELEDRVRDRTAQLAAARDQLQREQDRLRFIFDTMPIGLSFTTTQPDGTSARLINEAHLHICGFTREAARNQADFARISHPEDYERQIALVRELEAGKINRFSIDKRYVRPDGQIVWVELTAQRRVLPDGSREDLAVVVDITERKRSEDAQRLTNQQLEVQRTRLEAANAELEAFSYSVSHDLRAPLRHVHGFASLLEQHAGSTLDDKGRRLLHTIRDAAKQMGTLIDDLLAFSRAGRTPLQPVEVAHDALLAGVIRDGRYENGHPIIWEISPLPAVRADPAMLRQVWSNLIENAVKYSRKNAHPRIVIGSETNPEKNEAIFSVRDNGVGFDPAYADKLFGVFQRLHSPAEFEGTGIGLANVRRIVARHGGRTWAESGLGAGATFFFTLPIA